MPDGKRRGSGTGASDLRKASRTLREYALSFPGATEDFPWGERVAKVKGKVFVFLGSDPVPGGPMGLSVKLPESGQDALDLPFAKPTGYGLGKSGWVTATFESGDDPPLEILKGWIRESYRAVAPKRLVTGLEDPGPETPRRRPRSRRGRKPARARPTG
jgi:predicted DNA-binding protein (MmcQ/YjbR family)